MKQAQRQQKRSLAEVCKERLEFLHDARRQKEDAKKKERYRQIEDEVMAMTHGPNWKTKHLPDDPIEKEKIDDEFDEFVEEPVTLKAS